MIVDKILNIKFIINFKQKFDKFYIKNLNFLFFIIKIKTNIIKKKFKK